ncbi:hypothetical protein OQA88_1002 [Cercophora sp. LCS_1]
MPKLLITPTNPKPLSTIPTFRPSGTFLPAPGIVSGTAYAFSPVSSSQPTTRTEQVQIYDGKWFFTVRLPTPSVQEEHALLLHTDGGCRSNGTPDAVASWGVFAGFMDRGCPYNLYGRLDRNLPQTSSRGEIEALRRAVKLAREMVREYAFLKGVWIVSDSEYLVKGMTVWMGGWLRKGGRKSDGKEVEHWDVLREIWGDLWALSGSVGVTLWWARREVNQAADGLAGMGLGLQEGEVRGGDDVVVRRAFAEEMGMEER